MGYRVSLKTKARLVLVQVITRGAGTLGFLIENHVKAGSIYLLMDGVVTRKEKKSFHCLISHNRFFVNLLDRLKTNTIEGNCFEGKSSNF